MDWGKVGAIAGIGCFALAALSVLLQISLLWRGKAGQSRPKQTPDMRVIGTLLILGFLLSGVAAWSADVVGPIAGTVAATKWAYTPLTQITRVTFHDETVVLDGKLFVECTWGANVVLKYDGGAPFQMLNGTLTKEFYDTYSVASDNLALIKFIQFCVEGGLFKRPQRMIWGQK